MNSKLLTILLAFTLLLSSCTQAPPATEPENPESEQESTETLDLSTPEKIESNLSILRLESFELPVETEGWEKREIVRHYKNDTLVKLSVALNDDMGKMSGKAEFYFNENGQLLSAVYPFNKYSFEAGKLTGVSDENGNPLDFDESSLIVREAYAYEMAARYAEIDENFGYDLKSAEFENGDINIEYPVIDNFKGELLQDYMNQSLAKITEQFKSDSWKSADIGYVVTSRNDTFLSVKFIGSGEPGFMDKEVNIMKSVTLDIGNSSNEITFDNFVTDPEGLKSFLKTYTQSDLEYEGLNFYFSGPYVTFYHMPLDDSAAEFTEISVPMNLVEPFVTWNFGDKPAS